MKLELTEGEFRLVKQLARERVGDMLHRKKDWAAVTALYLKLLAMKGGDTNGKAD